MSIGYFFDAGDSIKIRDASPLLPVDALDADVYQHRDAELVLDGVDPDDVVVVAPDGMASGCFLASHPTSIIPIRTLPTGVRRSLEDSTDIDLSEFTHLQVGRGDSPSENHSLSEF